MARLAGAAEFVAIMNPNSGPGREGTLADPSYVTAITNLRSAGGKVIGYVPSGFAGRDIRPDDQSTDGCEPRGNGGTFWEVDDIVECATRYEELYGDEIDGIFVDEMSFDETTTLETARAFYEELTDKIRAAHPDWVIFGNPGTFVDFSLIELVDTAVTSEVKLVEYGSELFPDYHFDNAAERFAVIVYEADLSSFAEFLERSRSANTSYIYFTQDELPNPYDETPSNLDEQVAAVQSINVEQ